MSAADICRKEKYSRCIALEEDYVHQVYEKIGKDLSQAKDPLEGTVKNFLDDLEPGSLVADIGCGDGRHLQNKNGIFSLGADSSCLQASLARQRCQEVLLGDNLRLPLRGNAFDAVLSVGVIHHFTTKERRIKALKEIARILKIGGRVLIAVQRHNSQTSQDVLIPWFDVPKDKKIKDRRWFDQDSGEFELDDDRDEDDEEDSISLPSSDEEDTPWTNYAKFFPPQTHHAKKGWNCERQSRSLDYDYQTSSNNVPNSKQLVQTNACYAFVRKALKRFSSVNTSDEDPYFMSELYHRVDSAVPPSPASGQEQKFDLLNNSSFDEIELVQKTISDNFIELLNIDDEQKTSSFLPRRDCTDETLCRTNSKNDSPVKNNKNLIRSLSGMFKNVNSLWSSKGTKSCSDLKSHVVSDGNNFKGNKERESRLVRSKTTATCNPEFDYFTPLENIEELDMTMSEANKIINDFLESTIPSVETVKSRKYIQDKKIFTPLTHFDIVNGNTLPFIGDSSENTSSKHRYRKYEKLNEISKCYSFRENKTDRVKQKYDYDLCKEVSFSELGLTQGVKSMQFSNDFKANVLPSNEKCSNYENTCTVGKGKKCTDNQTSFVIYGDDNTIFDKKEFEDRMLSKTSFYQDKISNCELPVQEIEEVPDISSKMAKQTENISLEISNINATKPLIADDQECSSTNVNSDSLKSSDISMPCENNVLNAVNQNKLPFTNVINDSFFNSKSNKIAQNSSSLIPSAKFWDTKKQEEICGIKQILQANSSINNKYHPHNSPKRLRNFNQNYNYQMAGSKTLGPFYDEDNDDICTSEDATLSSYYSMPELHALTEFYQEYNIYQNYIVNNTSEELSKDIYTPKNANIFAVDKISKNNLESLKDPNNDNILQMSSENHMYRKSLTNDFCIQTMKTDLCNSIQSAFTTARSSEEGNRMNNADISNDTIVKNDFKMLPLIPPSSINLNSPIELNNRNKCRSLICINTKISSDQSDNKIYYGQLRKMSRSQSVGTIQEGSNVTKCTEIHILSELTSSNTSLTFSQEKNEKPILNLNKLKLLQRNSYKSDSLNAFENETSINKHPVQNNYLLLERRIDIKGNKRSFDGTNRDFATSQTKISSVEESYPSLYSPEKSLDSNDSIEIENQLQVKNSCHILSETQFPLSSSKGKKEHKTEYVEKFSGQEKDYICAQDTENLKGFLQSQNTDNRKIIHSDITDHNSASTLLSENLLNQSCQNHALLDELKYKENIPSCKYISQNKREFEVIYGFPTKVSLKSSSPKVTSMKSVCHCDSSSCKSCQNNSQEYSTDKRMQHFSPSNISRNDPISSSFQHEELRCVESNFQNGAKNETKSSEENLKAVASPEVFTDAFPNRRLVPSNSLDYKHFDPLETIEKSEHKHLSDSNASNKENINYAYGRIHEVGAAVVGHRYHHLFEEEELDDLIENCVSDLHVLSSFHQESHWCIIAEKVRVWTI